jgi:uncharacterized protein (TIGR02996 family)
MREAFEQAIVANPDDAANYAAYGDWLAEQGDPRGEFIQVQLALEDPACRGKRRREMQAREKDLLATHQEEWLGPLAEFLPPRGMPAHVAEELATDGPPPVRFARGFLYGLHLGILTVPLARALRDAPQTRLLRELAIEGGSVYDEPPFDPGEDVPADLPLDAAAGIYPLLGRDSFPCLRSFRLGDEVDTDSHWPDKSITHYVCVMAPLAPLVEKMPRLEELHLLCKQYDVEPLFSLKTVSRLRVLRIYHLGVHSATWPEDRQPYPYPLDRLAANRSLRNLTHLLLHPHCVEEGGGSDTIPSFLPLEQVRYILRARRWTQLTHLQLRLSDMGDAGCRALVKSGILRRLKWLDLRYGCITDEGARILADCPDLKNLEHLDLGRNALTEAGIGRLRSTGINLRVDDQLTPQELADARYLFDGDGE